MARSLNATKMIDTMVDILMDPYKLPVDCDIMQFLKDMENANTAYFSTGKTNEILVVLTRYKVANFSIFEYLSVLPKVPKKSKERILSRR